MSYAEKKSRLGVSMGTAQRRLMRALLFRELCSSGRNACVHCQQPMTLKDFSIEHISGWADYSEFMAVESVAYSHMLCNTIDGNHRRSKDYAPMAECIRTGLRNQRLRD